MELPDIVIDETEDSENTVGESTIRKKLQWDTTKSIYETLKPNMFSSQTFQKDLGNAMKIKNTRKSHNEYKRRKPLNAGVSEQFIVDSCWNKLLNGESNNNLMKTQRIYTEKIPMTARPKANPLKNESIQKLKPKIGQVKIFTTKAKKLARSLSPLVEQCTPSVKPALNTSRIDKEKALKKPRRKREDRKKDKENVLSPRYIIVHNQANRPNFHFPIASPGMKQAKGNLVMKS